GGDRDHVRAGEVRQRPPLGQREADERPEVVGLVGVPDQQRGGVERRERRDRLTRHGAGGGGRQDDVGLGHAGGLQVGGQRGHGLLVARRDGGGGDEHDGAAGAVADVGAGGGAVRDRAHGHPVRVEQRAQLRADVRRAQADDDD